MLEFNVVKQSSRTSNTIERIDGDDRVVDQNHTIRVVVSVDGGNGIYGKHSIIYSQSGNDRFHYEMDHHSVGAITSTEGYQVVIGARKAADEYMNRNGNKVDKLEI